MRPNFPIWIFCFSLLLTGAPSFLSAQKIRSHPFKYDNRKNGTFTFSLTYVRAQEPNNVMEPKEGFIDMAGAESGTLRFTFYSNGINFERGKHRDQYVLIVRPTCNVDPRELRATSKNDVEVQYSDDRREQIVEYKIQENGSGQLLIGFDVVEKGVATSECHQKILFSYNITGISDPSIRACEQAMAAFKSDKFGTIGQLKSVRNRYPNAPCAEEADKILTQYNLYKQADDAAKTDCEKAKKLCAQYKSIHGESGWFAAEINLIEKCVPPQPKPANKPAPVVTTAPSREQLEQKAYEKIRNTDNTADILAFIDEWGAINPDSRFVKMAREKIAGLLPLQYEEKVLADGRRQYRLLNADRPRLKDMSLRSGLKIETEQLLSDNTFTVTPGSANEYAIFVKDAKGKQATIKITNEFDASLTPLPGSEDWLLRISGSKKPYTIYLTDDANPNDKKTWKGAMNSDTLTITSAELKKRGYEKTYRVVVKSSDRLTRPIEAGTIVGAGSDGGTALLDTIMLLLLLFVTCCAAYGLYLLLLQKRAQARKSTIYDRIQ